MKHRTLLRALPLLLATLCVAGEAHAARTLEEYRYFRALSIDLQGRMPTREEVGAFERPDFDVDRWIDQHLQGPAYAERLRRVYTDLMRLELSNAFQFVPPPVTLRRFEVMGPDGHTLYVYFRRGQRRQRPETDGAFCLSQSDTGLQFPPNAPPTGTAHPISQEVLDANTVLVRPWWLYRDYRNANPTDRYDPSWARTDPGYQPVPELLTEPDGTTPTAAVRICREEAQTSDMGTIFAPGRMNPPAGMPLPYGRIVPFPSDSGYARTHRGEPISCLSGTAFAMSPDCGCGPGLERCYPTNSWSFDPQSFNFPTRVPFGYDATIDRQAQPMDAWPLFWWGQEAVHFLDYVFSEDRDFREVLTARYSFVNGPLAQFYRTIANTTCCSGDATSLGYAQPDPLFSPSSVPAALLPHDTDNWQRVDDRGPHASGLLTMPIFLTKYGTRRARAHVLYSTFLCRDFIAGNVQLMPSTEPNLMIRSGCSTCHAALEPLAAYFTRITESGWTFLPSMRFPTSSTTCVGDVMTMSRQCRTYYDPAFSDARHGTLRGAYASTDHADQGPAGIAEYLLGNDQFAPCVVENITESFLGRPLTSEDDALKAQLRTAFTTAVPNEYHVRALVRALVHADAYRHANNLSSTAWRQGGMR